MVPESPARKPWWRRWFGTRSERAAARFLKRLGYRIVSRNYVCAFGELDLVAVDGRCIVFVEVRSTGEGDA
ncbi:MAG TPA: YraN family protein, partial [Gemmataceae bacterium]|nr:YraN family protein [Gemmataceae bacterium]